MICKECRFYKPTEEGHPYCEHLDSMWAPILRWEDCKYIEAKNTPPEPLLKENK